MDDFLLQFESVALDSSSRWLALFMNGGYQNVDEVKCASDNHLRTPPEFVDVDKTNEAKTPRFGSHGGARFLK